MIVARFLKIPALICAAALALVVAPALHAQEPAPAVTDVTEAELQAFAHAYLDIAEISEQLAAQVAEAEEQEEAARLQEQAQQQMEAAVEARGLSAEEYQEIGAALNADEELRERFIAALTEVQAERGTP